MSRPRPPTHPLKSLTLRCVLLSQYTRYGVEVKPSNASSAEVNAIQARAAVDNGTTALASWLVETGGTWSGASVEELGVSVVETSYLTTASSAGEHFVFWGGGGGEVVWCLRFAGGTAGGVVCSVVEKTPVFECGEWCTFVENALF